MTTTLLVVKGILFPGPLKQEVLNVFKKGGVIAYPTETFYGLCVDPFNETAVKKLFYLKGRDFDKPVSILIKDKEMLFELVEDVPLQAEILIDKFWPGPLTIIFRAKRAISSVLTGNTGKVGVRISSNHVAQQLTEITGSPITATSANPSGKKSPVTVREVIDYFGNRVDLILDGGILSGKLGSTIVDVTGKSLAIIREGEIPLRILTECLEEGKSRLK